MKFLVLCMHVGVCLANKKKHHEEPAKRTGGDNLRPSKVPFPDYFRVEVEIQRMENNGSMRSDGKACDWGSACDPEISAVIDMWVDACLIYISLEQMEKREVLFGPNYVTNLFVEKLVAERDCRGKWKYS